jgi:uncharacterized protein YutE (UPF0331/DUF86 family)
MANDSLSARIEARFTDLLPAPGFAHGQTGYVGDGSSARQWITASANLLALVTARRGMHWEATQTILAKLDERIDTRGVSELEGVLAAVDADRKLGLLNEVAYQIYAETFDDFLDQAERMHKSGSLEGSSVLAAAVLEDTMKKIAAKNNIQPAPGLEETINALAAAGVFTGVTAKRLKAWAGVRTAAMHARWDELDLKGVADLIRGTRELVSDYLDG